MAFRLRMDLTVQFFTMARANPFVAFAADGLERGCVEVSIAVKASVLKKFGFRRR